MSLEYSDPNWLVIFHYLECMYLHVHQTHTHVHVYSFLFVHPYIYIIFIRNIMHYII